VLLHLLTWPMKLLLLIKDVNHGLKLQSRMRECVKYHDFVEDGI